MKKILITGGTGFIGTKLIETLKSYEIYVLDNFSPQIHPTNYRESEHYKNLNSKTHLVVGDITDENSYNNLPTDFDFIIHLAAETGTGQSMYQIKKYSDVNVSGTALLLEKMVLGNQNLKKVIVASSRAIYGEGKYKNPKTGLFDYPNQRLENDLQNGRFEPLMDGENLELCATDENSEFKPSSVYGITKLSQELLVRNLCESLGIPFVALRFQNVYGPGQSLKNPYTGILSIFSGLLLENKPINIFEDGKESRDFVYIDDVVNSIVLSLEKEEANFEVFNVGTGIAKSVLEVANLLKSFYKSNSELKISGNFRLGDIRHNKADIAKIKEKLNYEPKVDFESGLQNFTQWVLSQNIDSKGYENSLQEMKSKGLFK